VTGKLMLIATLTRPGTIAAADITLTSREPTLALCRALIAAGHADQPMTVVDSATGRPVMQVASIAKAALLTVDEGNGCRFRCWRPFRGGRGAPGVASDDAGVVRRVGDRRDPGGRFVSRRCLFFPTTGLGSPKHDSRCVTVSGKDVCNHLFDVSRSRQGMTWACRGRRS
jgi:hypothetical protein